VPPDPCPWERAASEFPRPLRPQDVVLASGCSGAIDLAITVLANPGDVILIPAPAFALYQTLAESKGVAVDHYRLDPTRSWEADLPHLRSLVARHGGRVAAILVNNPSNPCGSVYGEAHLRDILAIAEDARVPIIADEIYGGLVFPSTGASFHALAGLTATVPVLSCGGIAKEFLVPGWRLGWVIVHDRSGALSGVREGLVNLSQLILGANSLVVAALPSILDPTEGSPEAASLSAFRAATIAQLEHNAALCAVRLSIIPGLSVVVPQGAMYVMFGIEEGFFAAAAAAGEGGRVLRNDVDFAEALLAEENVFVLPGTCFTMPRYCRCACVRHLTAHPTPSDPSALPLPRIVFTAPAAKLCDAFDRLEHFVVRHAADPAAAAAALEAGRAAAASRLAAVSLPFAAPTVGA
jgi:tyrosine aminotransferase